MPNKISEKNEKPISQADQSNNDLPDSPHDAERLEPEEIVIDLPDVSDIPGQENIIPPKMAYFIDTTISSDDEEGAGLFDSDDITEENKNG